MTYVRSFDSKLELRDDEVFGRIFPFGEVAHIREMVDGKLDEYDEEFLPACTTRMRQTAERNGGQPRWIKLTLDHDNAWPARVGFCRSLVEVDEGVDATFKLYPSADIAKVRSILSESHDGLSIEFADIAPPVVKGDLRQRRQIHIDAVAATPIPVYQSARIMAMRADEMPPYDTTPNLDRVREMLAAANV